VRSRLEHPLYDPNDTQVCLIVKDPQREYKDKLEEKQIKVKRTKMHAA
jgi:ribosome biogenesis protein UTP30